MINAANEQKPNTRSLGDRYRVADMELAADQSARHARQAGYDQLDDGFEIGGGFCRLVPRGRQAPMGAPALFVRLDDDLKA
jgi:hypothetical protein